MTKFTQKITGNYLQIAQCLEQQKQDLGLQCQTSVRLKVVVKSIWALFETKILYEPNFHFVNLNLFCFLSMFFGTQHFFGPQNKSKKLKIKKIG